MKPERLAAVWRIVGPVEEVCNLHPPAAAGNCRAISCKARKEIHGLINREQKEDAEMRSRMWFVYLVFGFALSECFFFASIFAQTNETKIATIKKKNGEVVKGQINGIVVQGKSGPVSTGSKTGYGALYYAGK
ncbi:MAG: hypothetical protein ACRD9Y_11995, partial [Blastocatellia bacterium]